MPLRPRHVVRPAGVPTRQPTHPGQFLNRHILRPLELTQSQAAELLGVSRRRVNELTQGQRAMSADTAIRCAMAFGVRTDFWLALQANWDCFEAWRRLRQQGAGSARSGRRRPLPHP